MSKHTPGPWVVDEANLDLVQTANGDYICEVNPFSFSLSNHDEEQCEANARLIAAAPELLAALEHYLIQDEIAESYGGGVGGSAREQARAAIAKATGAEQ